MAGPSLPSGAYSGSFVYPCVSAVGENTGIIMFGAYYSGAWLVHTQVQSYNFTSGTWKRLKDSPVKRKFTVCHKVTLASKTNVILVTGKLSTF